VKQSPHLKQSEGERERVAIGEREEGEDRERRCKDGTEKVDLATAPKEAADQGRKEEAAGKTRRREGKGLNFTLVKVSNSNVA